jgi:hypothetical protein
LALHFIFIALRLSYVIVRKSSYAKVPAVEIFVDQRKLFLFSLDTNDVGGGFWVGEEEFQVNYSIRIAGKEGRVRVGVY